MWKGGGSGGGMVGLAHVVEKGPETEADKKSMAGLPGLEAREGLAGRTSEVTT